MNEYEWDHRPTFAEVHQAVGVLDESLPPEDPAYGLAVLLLSASVIGPDVVALSEFTGQEEATVARVAAILRANGLWDRQMLALPRLINDRDRVPPLWAYVSVASGAFRVVDFGENGAPAFAMTPQGLLEAEALVRRG